MNPAYFSIIGYLSILLWLCVPLLWLGHWFKQPRGWLPHIALGIALASLFAAKINSEFYVNRIQPDRSEEMAEWQAQQDAARKAAEESRAGDVAQIRFAEDAQGDFLDTAGMDESDLKYFESMVKGDDVPDWKKEKKTREGGGEDPTDLEAQIGGREAEEGMATESLDEAEAAVPVLLPAAELAIANRLDSANLTISMLLALLAAIVVVVDYLRRANVYEEAYCPLPIPSAWPNAFTPMKTALVRPASARRSVSEELAWLNKRGESFVYLGRETVPSGCIPVAEDMEDDFVFEALWYGRASFAIEQPDRALQVLRRFCQLLEQRKQTRARVRQTARVVLDIQDLDWPQDEQDTFIRYAALTGFSLFIIRGTRS